MNRFWYTLSTLLAHYYRHKLQTLFLLAGMVTGVALWSAVQLVNSHARASYSEANQLLGAEAAFWIRHRRGDGVAVDQYLALRHQGFTQIYPVVEFRAVANGGALISVLATDLMALPMANGDSSFLSAGGDWLSFVQPPYQTWYPEALARTLKLQAGDELLLKNGQRLPPAVIQTRSGQGQQVLVDIGAAFALRESEQFSYLGVAQLRDEDKERLMSLLPSHLELVKNEQALDLTELTSSLHTNLTAMALLSFAVGMFIVFNAVRFSLVIRHSTYRTFRELGVDVGLINLAICGEAFMWSVVGTALGLPLGVLVGEALLPAAAQSLNALYDANIGAEFHLDFHLIATAFGLTLVGMLLALAAPLWVRSQQTVAEFQRSSDSSVQDQKVVSRMNLAAVLLLVAAGVLYPNFTTVEGGFVLIALVLFAGTLLLPTLIQWAALLTARLLPTPYFRVRWAVSDVIAQLPHLRIALMALLLALTANIGVGTLVTSFRDALSGWLEHRLSASIYIQGHDVSVETLAAEPWVRSVSTRTGVSFRWQNRPASVRGLEPDAEDVLQMALIDERQGGATAWRLPGSGDVPAIIANEQVRYLAGVSPGAVVELPTDFGPQPFRIIGFVHDYGNPGYQFYLPQKVTSHYWKNARRLGTAIWVEEVDISAATDGLISLGLPPGDWILQDDIRRISLSIFDRTFAITGALNTLTFMVAGLALLSAMLAVHQFRLPDYSLWHAMGLTRGEWMGIVGLPLLVMVTVTGLFAIPLGWLLSWLLIHKLNVIAFGWTMPVTWSWLPVVYLLLVTLLVVSTTLGLSLWQVRRDLPTAIKQMNGVA